MAAFTLIELATLTKQLHQSSLVKSHPVWVHLDVLGLCCINISVESAPKFIWKWKKIPLNVGCLVCTKVQMVALTLI